LSRVLVLGAGRVGGLIAQDLAEDPGLEVTLADRSTSALEQTASAVPAGAITTIEADLVTSGAVTDLAAGADVVVGAVPGRFGLAMLREVIAAGKPVVDISFSPESPLVLHDEAVAGNVPVVVDCGVAPGLSNLLAGRAVAELDRTDSISIMVGGLPVHRFLPYEYRSVFSPTDVVEEYTRPCRMRVGGREVTVEALTGIEPVDFPGIGTLEAFNTDGLRTLLEAPEMMSVPDMTEKTLRYPGHAEKMWMLRETGFFDDTPIVVEGVKVRPRALTEELLFKAWEPSPGEKEFTVLRVKAEGELDGRPRCLTWDLLDTTDQETGTSSMARTTGFPCAIVARMLAAGEWSVAGVAPPERLGADAAVTARILDELSRRGVQVHRQDD
jgi:lysine 6-dehydrogenase